MAKGGKVLLGGKRDASRAGNFFIPTVIANVDHNMRVMTEEVSTAVDWSYVMREVKHRDGFSLVASVCTELWSNYRCATVASRLFCR